MLRHALVGANGSVDRTTDPRGSEIGGITDRTHMQHRTHMQTFRASRLSMINDIN